MTRPFCRLPVFAPFDDRMTSAELRLLVLICARCDNRTDICDLPNSYFARVLSIGDRRVRRSMGKLAELGWIERIDAPGRPSTTRVAFDHNPCNVEMVDPGSPGPGVDSTPGTPGPGVDLHPGPPDSGDPGSPGPGDPGSPGPPHILDSINLDSSSRERASPSGEASLALPRAFKNPSKSISRSHRRPRKVPAPQILPPAWWAEAVRAVPGIDTDHEFDLFRAHYVGSASEVEWGRRWRKWLRNGIPKKLADQGDDAAPETERDEHGNTCEEFARRSIAEYRAELGDAPGRAELIRPYEEAALNLQAWKIFDGKDEEFGIERLGVVWSAVELKERVNRRASGPRLVADEGDHRSAAS